jgi:hypothetical protein
VSPWEDPATAGGSPQRAKPNALFVLGGVLLLIPFGGIGLYAFVAAVFAAVPIGEGDMAPGGWDDVLLLAAFALGLAAVAGAFLSAAFACVVRGIRGRWPRWRALIVLAVALPALLAALVVIGQAPGD